MTASPSPAAGGDLFGPIFQTSINTDTEIPLYVYLVKGARYAVWIDTGVKSMFPQLLDTMQRAKVRDDELRFVLHTHTHPDHFGCNAQLKARTKCLLAAPARYAAWHEDFDLHFREFARPFPHLLPEDPTLREEILGMLDVPCPLDIHIEEGTAFDLGGGVKLRAYNFPGHMEAEVGWFESSTHTLILGDSITGLNWSFFHGHLDVPGYRSTLEKIRSLLYELSVQRVLFAHYAPMRPPEVLKLLDQASQYIDSIEATLMRLLAGNDETTLETLWMQLCSRMGRQREFRSLDMVNAHVRDLMTRRIIKQVGNERYTLR